MKKSLFRFYRQTTRYVLIHFFAGFGIMTFLNQVIPTEYGTSFLARICMAAFFVIFILVEQREEIDEAYKKSKDGIDVEIF